jgi:hypothetical protein
MLWVGNALTAKLAQPVWVVNAEIPTQMAFKKDDGLT